MATLQGAAAVRSPVTSGHASSSSGGRPHAVLSSGDGERPRGDYGEDGVLSSNSESSSGIHHRQAPGDRGTSPRPSQRRRGAVPRRRGGGTAGPGRGGVGARASQSPPEPSAFAGRSGSAGDISAHGSGYGRGSEASDSGPRASRRPWRGSQDTPLEGLRRPPRSASSSPAAQRARRSSSSSPVVLRKGGDTTDSSPPPPAASGSAASAGVPVARAQTATTDSGGNSPAGGALPPALHLTPSVRSAPGPAEGASPTEHNASTGARRVRIGGSTHHEISPSATAADLPTRPATPPREAGQPARGAGSSGAARGSPALAPVRLTGGKARKAAAPLSLAKALQPEPQPEAPGMLKAASFSGPTVKEAVGGGPKRAKALRPEHEARLLTVRQVERGAEEERPWEPLLDPRTDVGPSSDAERAVAVACTARSYDLEKLYKFMPSRRREAEVSYCGEAERVTERVLLVVVPADSYLRGAPDMNCEIFFFNYGVVAFWGPNDRRLWDALLGDIEAAGCHAQDLFTSDGGAELDVERCSWSYERDEARQYALTTSASDTGYDAPATPRKARESKLDNDHFQLSTQEPDIKLAYSFAMAQSQKLTSFEDRIDDLISRTRRFPRELEQFGEVELSSREVAKRKGELFTQRMEISLYTDLLDTPDFFWERTDLEPLYKNGRGYFEISRRVRVLNERLSVVAELFDMLHEQQKQKHSDRLEWIVIWLVAAEVVAALIDILLKFFPMDTCPACPTCPLPGAAPSQPEAAAPLAHGAPIGGDLLW